MEIRQLQTFLSIVKHMNFTRAADELGYAQSTVTTQIKNLEDYYGVQLFERIGRNIYLTEQGLSLVPLAEEMMILYEKANAMISSKNQIAGELKVATPESLCIKWFPKVYKKLAMKHPAIKLDIITFNCYDYESLLRKNIIDLAFVIHYENIEDEFEILGTWDLNMHVLISPNHVLSDKVKIDPKDLDDQRLVLTEKDCCYRNYFDTLLDKYNVCPKEVLSLTNIHVIKELVMSGYGIAFLPEFAVSDEINDERLVVLKGIEIDNQFKTSLICHKEKWITPRMRAFIDIVKEVSV
ncbi:MAG: LysR family transcriptional regulator [Clostridiales bacterium]|nr:LysR family transcriptional regulator [Clostridiales bacterium]